MSKQCKNCSQWVPEDSKFCVYCGKNEFIDNAAPVVESGFFEAPKAEPEQPVESGFFEMPVEAIAEPSAVQNGYQPPVESTYFQPDIEISDFSQGEAPQEQTEKSRKSNKGLIIALIAFLCVLLVGIGVFAAKLIVDNMDTEQVDADEAEDDDEDENDDEDYADTTAEKAGDGGEAVTTSEPVTTAEETTSAIEETTEETTSETTEETTAETTTAATTTTSPTTTRPTTTAPTTTKPTTTAPTTTKPSTATTPSDFTAGTLKGKTYTNEWANIKFTMPSGYTFSSESVDDMMLESVSFTNDADKSVLVIGVMDLDFGAALIDEKTILSMLAEESSTDGNNSYTTMNIGGEAYESVEFTTVESSEQAVCTVCVRKVETYVIMIVAMSPDKADNAALLKRIGSAK